MAVSMGPPAVSMLAGYKSFLACPLARGAPNGPSLGCMSPPWCIPPSIQWHPFLQRLETMATRLNDLGLGAVDASRPPVLLLGGINLVRALGLAGIPVVVASPDRDDPVFASRYCKGHCILPGYEHAEAAVDAIVAVGDRLREACGRRVPLMYGSDDALELIHAHRDRLQRHFLLLLNERGIGEALIAKDRFKELAHARGLPVPRDLAWAGNGEGSVASAPRAV